MTKHKPLPSGSGVTERTFGSMSGMRPKPEPELPRARWRDRPVQGADLCRLWVARAIGPRVARDRLGKPDLSGDLPKGLSPNNRVRWNRIEHRLFAFITQNWRGKPLLTHQVIVQLIASTTTRTGLTVQCRLDRGAYAKGIKVSDAEMATFNLQPAAFHGDRGLVVDGPAGWVGADIKAHDHGTSVASPSRI